MIEIIRERHALSGKPRKAASGQGEWMKSEQV